MLLAIDTSTRNASVALYDGGRVASTLAWHSTVNHSAELMPAVAQLLERRSARPSDLDGVAVALGPGGFSALRTGLSVAKGLAMASRIPVVGIGSLDLEAYPYRDAGLPVCALLEAGRSEASSALIDREGRRYRDDGISGWEELLSEIQSLKLDGPILFCGEGMAPWADAIRDALGSQAVPCYNPPSSRGGSLAALAQQRLERGEADDLDSLQPHYLRMPTIGVPKRRDRRVQESARRAAGRSGRAS